MMSMLENNFVNPWDKLDMPQRGHVSSRRVGTEYQYDFYFARDCKGSYMLVFSITSDVVVEYEPISLNGMYVNNVSVGDAPSIVLILKNSLDWPIFLKVCVDLCEVSSGASTEKKAVKSFYNRLRYWSYFLDRGYDDKLSKEEQVGLIGELLVISNYLIPEYNALDAVNFWTGADADVQDFFIADKRIEVKTCTSPSKNEVCISSAEQLYDAGCPVFLVVVYIGVATSEGEGVFSLSSLAMDVSERLKHENVEAYDIFVKKLAMVGMSLDGSYNDIFYCANQFKAFKIVKDFPRITSDELRVGVSRVKYMINIGVCSDYEITIDGLFRKE